MSLQGKGIYIWQIDRCENGNVNQIAALAAQAKLSHVLIKVADGTQEYGRNAPKAAALVLALRSKGISPWGWQYVYGHDPVPEARIAIQQIQKYHLDGFIVNAEAEYKQSGRKAAAQAYMNTLRNALPQLPIGLSSYRFPSYHPQLPWREFLGKCDINFPQVYWQGAHNPALQLQRSLREFQGMTPVRPYFPTGAAYSEHNWQPTRADIEAFMREAQILNLPGVNFWEWAPARALGFWDTIANFEWDATPKPKDIAEKFIDALNSRNPDLVLNLYQETAVHVNAARTVRGHTEIRNWYVDYN